MRVLGIETSCDETSAAVVDDGVNIVSNIIASQIDIHARFGGVVPEVASRRHVELIMPTVQQALDEAGCTLADIDCIGVINRPGLIGALIVGVASAKTIAYAANIPLVAVHHIEAHLYANWLTGAHIEFPLVCLVVSGGHSDLIYMTDHGQYEILARTRDDAAGECFDKCARAMGLGYPGGPEIDKLAKTGNPHSVQFPRAKVGDTLDFSFSGLKTAVIRYVEGFEGKPPTPDLAASFQAAIVDVLVDHTFRAAHDRGVRQVLMAGGVAANSSLQAAMKQRGEELDIAVSAPPPVLCTDNAAMAASAAFFARQRGESAGLDLDSFASEPLGKRAI
ncbi:tRNA (adenosine(37)-N6)-threonylcarbamoyltransferase complex transferase subunit TsaD [bacterium]|nr:tRNA (adenosine(37)-N6)-threonylcarbamoyltransferase complex transferase subunit TsaD [bacterium]